MTTNTVTPDTAADTTDETLEDSAPVAEEFATKADFEKGTWQHTVQQSSILFKRSGDAKKRASTMLWTGATAAISEWEADSDTDVNAEGLATNLLIIMGTSRKGDVSKIKTVALAVRNNGLDTSQWPNLSKAYGEAIRLTKTAVAEAAEDNAGEDAINAIAADAPATATTPSSAIKMALALTGDFDEFFKVMLDVINAGGDENVSAHRAALRSLAAEVSGRAKPAPVAAAPATNKAGASQATAGPGEGETAVVAQSKPKSSARQTAVPTETGAPAKATGNGKTKPRATPTAPVEAPVEASTEGDIFSEVDSEDSTPAPVATKTASAKPRRA